MDVDVDVPNETTARVPLLPSALQRHGKVAAMMMMMMMRGIARGAKHCYNIHVCD